MAKDLINGMQSFELRMQNNEKRRFGSPSACFGSAQHPKVPKSNKQINNKQFNQIHASAPLSVPQSSQVPQSKRPLVPKSKCP